MALSWTAVDAGHWDPPPEVTYTVTRDDGATVAVVAEAVAGLGATDTGVVPGAAYTYQVSAVVDGGAATHSAPRRVVAGNLPPLPAGTLADRTLRVEDGAVDVDVAAAFSDPENDVLTYGAVSSAPAVAGVSVSGTTVRVTPSTAGTATITVAATDAVGSRGTAAQSFRVTMPEPVHVDYDLDDDGLIEIATLAQLDAVRHDLDGDGVPAGAAAAPSESAAPGESAGSGEATADSGEALARGAAAHAAAFPDTAEGMGCPWGVPPADAWAMSWPADLDFDTDGSGAADANDAYWNGGAGWRPLGTLDESFAGVFSGNGRTVSHLFVAGGDNAGLFGMSSGVIRGVGVVAADVTGSQCAGALAGLNGGRVEASWSTGAVTGDSCVGGLVGVNGLWVPHGGTFRPLEVS